MNFVQFGIYLCSVGTRYVEKVRVEFFFVTQALQQSGLRSCVVAAEVAVEVVVKSVQVALKLIKNLL